MRLENIQKKFYQIIIILEKGDAKFREYVDSLNDFTNNEIDILVKNKIYNAENLQKK